MITEKMLETSLLYHIINDLHDSDIKKDESGQRFILDVNGVSYDLDKMIARLNSLLSEFVSPYAIDNTSKED